MGLLAALNLPQPKSWPSAAAASVAAPTAAGAAVGRRPERLATAGPPDDFEDEVEAPPQKVRTSAPATEAPQPSSTKDAAGAGAGQSTRDEIEAGNKEVSGDESATEDEGTAAEPIQVPGEPVEGKAAASERPQLPGSPQLPESLQVKKTKDAPGSITFKKTPDGGAINVKGELTAEVFKDTFQVGPIPCFTKGEVSLAIEGEVSVEGDTAGAKVQLTAGGTFSIGVGVAKGPVTAGPLGSAKLTCSQGVAVTYCQAKGVAADAFVCQVKATGTVGFEASVKDGPKIKAEVKLVEWELLIVHVAGFADGKFNKGVRVEPGKDLQRLLAALKDAGPRIADAVEKYAPEKVKKAAEDGAKWVAESEEAKKIGDGTGVVLDKIKKETGVDIGSGAESVVRDLVDPGGETSAEATKRVEAEMAALNATHEDFMGAVQTLGLAPGGPLQSLTNADKDEYNAIVEVHRKEMNQSIFAGTPAGAWKPMLVALAQKRRERKAAQAAQEAERKKKQKADADAQAAADLARRVKAAETRMNAAEQAANGPGNLLNNKAPQGSKKRQYWTQGMKFRDPATLRKMQVASLQGEARIAKADEATALFMKAKVVFEQGVHVTD